MSKRDEHHTEKKLDKAVADCVRNNLLNDEIGQRHREAYFLGARDTELSSFFLERQKRHAWKEAMGLLTPFKNLPTNHGELVLGHAWDRPDVIHRMPVSYLAGNTLVTGSSGSGKTIRAYYMALSVLLLVNSVWLLDLRKKEFTRLRGAFRRAGKPLYCIDARQMKLNPLQPPVGVDPINWASQAADLLVQVLHLPPRASKLATTLIHKLYREVTDDRWPTLFCLLDATRAAKDANQQSRMALIDALEPLLFSTGDIFRYHAGWTTNDLCQHCIVFELDSVGETAKDLILNTILLGEFASRIARGVSNPAKPDLWIGLDEANRLAAGGEAGQFGLANIISIIRGTGIALDLSVQTADLHSQILANTASKVIGRTAHWPDLQSISRAMGLTRDQMQFLIHKLKPGRFAMQLSDGNSRHPFLLQIPNPRMAAIDALSVDIDPNDLGPLLELPVVPLAGSQTTTVESVVIPSKSLFDSEAQVRLLHAIASEPFIALRDLPKRVRMSTKTIKRLREELIAKGFIREREIHTGGPGRSSVCLELLDAGRTALDTHSNKGKQE